MWWWLACAEPDPRMEELSSDHGQLRAEMGVLDESVAQVTTRVGELETSVDRRLADVEARLEQLRKDLDQRTLRPTPSQSRASWVGRWEVRAVPVANHGCSNEIESNTFTWEVSAKNSATGIAVAIDGNTRFRYLEGTLAGGVLSALQTDGYDSSLVTMTAVGDGIEGYRVFSRIDQGRPCSMVWKLTGHR